MKLKSLCAGIAMASCCAHASFEDDTMVLVAYDPSDLDTYFIDLGVSAYRTVKSEAIFGGPLGGGGYSGSGIYLNSGGLAAFFANNPGSQWTIYGAINSIEVVAGPPAVNQSLRDAGMIGVSDNPDILDARISSADILFSLRAVWLNWLEDLSVIIPVVGFG